MTQTPPTGLPNLRLLVAIASFGDRNLEFLRKSIHQYYSLPIHTDVVVLSNAPKQLDSRVKVLLGLPSRDPWSLPFAHKKLFADSLDRYDLFAYSEDDMEVTFANILAFLQLTPELRSDEIAGFLRFEIDHAGRMFLPDVHASFHWKVTSVARRGPHTIAEFSNEHAAFYLLTRSQLQKAIASGGFIREPHEGRYDLLCSAATDPYTSCGFRKVICISAIRDFLIHHMPNRYANQIGISFELLEEQLQALFAIRDGRHPVTELCNVEPRVLQNQWSKSFYEPTRTDLVDLVPKHARSVLSIGCGWGATEETLIRRGHSVAALPLDSVIGAVAERRGIEVIYASLDEGLRLVEQRKFDAILVNCLLPLLEEPFAILGRCCRLLKSKGVIVVANPNFDYLPYLFRRLVRNRGYQHLRQFSQAGIHLLSAIDVEHCLEKAGLVFSHLLWQDERTDLVLSGAVSPPKGVKGIFRRFWQSLKQTGLEFDCRLCQTDNQNKRSPLQARWTLARLLARNWVLRAMRPE
jgi:2-polyprenyl-3-methyl-5-hydroxy-6-metoxy-1,4-benzoquinol methylase